MDYNTLLSQGIKLEDCKSYEVVTDGDETLIFVKLKANQRTCPNCKFEGTKLKEYKTKTIKSLAQGKNRTTIIYSLPRYVCPHCKKTYTHNINVYAYNSISTILKKRLLERFAEICPFKSIGNEFGLSENETIKIFDEIVPNLKHPMTEAICIDEFSNTRKDECKYACVILDFVSHEVIDILPSRTTPYLDEYFKKMTQNTRNNVKYVITDMYDGYISATKKWLPNATIAIDPFHYMEYLTNAVQKVRQRVFEKELEFYDRSWMGIHWRLLTERISNYPKQNMMLKNGMTISYEDRVLRFVRQDRELYMAYLEIQGVYRELQYLNHTKAASFFEMKIGAYLNSVIPEFVSVGKTWEHYKNYIINSFIIHKGKRLSNGPIEGFNKRVKELKNVMSGYRNKNRFYKRTILCYNSKKR